MSAVLQSPGQQSEADRKLLAELRAKAEKGDAAAQYSLGCRHNGQGVAKDEAEAVKWYRKAAEQGLALAQRNLGTMFASGKGVPKDSAEAVAWFRKAAEQGLAQAQFDLGTMLCNGDGVLKSNVNACLWLNLAAAGGYRGAVEKRNVVERQMTPEQIAEARRLSARFVPRNPPPDSTR